MTSEKVIDLQEKRVEKVYKDEGIDPSAIVMCMTPHDFLKLVEIIVREGVQKGKELTEILRENENLYSMGTKLKNGLILPCKDE